MALADDLDGICRTDHKNGVDRALAGFVAKDEAHAGDKEYEPEAPQLLAALRDQEHFSTLDLAALLSTYGYPMSRSTVQTWRATDKAAHPELYEGQNVRGQAGGIASARGETGAPR